MRKREVRDVLKSLVYKGNAKPKFSNLPYGNTGQTKMMPLAGGNMMGGPGSPYGGIGGVGQGEQVRVGPPAPPKPTPAPVDPLEEAMKQIIGQPIGGVDESTIRSQVTEAASGQYDPQIAALNQAMAQARQRGAATQKEVQDTYNQLQRYYKGAVKEAAKDYNTAAASSRGRTATLKNALQGTFGQVSGGLQNELRALGGPTTGVDALLADIAKTQYGEQVRADVSGAEDLAALAEMGQAHQDWLKRTKAISRNEGAEAVTDLKSQLMDYLNRTGSEVAGLSGQKKAAIAKGILDAMQSNAESVREQEADRFRQIQGLGDYQLKKQTAAQKAASAGTKLDPNASRLDKVLSQLTGPGQVAAFKDLLNRGTNWNTTKNTKAIQDVYGIQPGGVLSDPNLLAQMIKRGAEKLNMSPADQNAMWMAALQYYKG